PDAFFKCQGFFLRGFLDSLYLKTDKPQPRMGLNLDVILIYYQIENIRLIRHRPFLLKFNAFYES
ncbi:MAG TPA: hypothetical protein PKD18_23340, partial [Saprospiraceae bacterium]|nr:hypothetical protein [Saprospiraceae bacterium]